MKTGITAIYEVDDLGTTPARVNRRTGELYINKKIWKDLDQDARLFVLLHEAGHVDQDTRSELKADNYAFHAYAQAGKPLTKSIQALTRLLHFNNPQHFDRVKAQTHRAFSYDFHINGNQAADPEKLKNQSFMHVETNPAATIWDRNFTDYSDLFGIGEGKAKRQEKRKARRAARAEKKVEKAKIKGDKERAQMGLTDLPAIPSPGEPAQGGKNNTVIYIGAAVAAALIIGIIIYFVTRK